VREGILIVLLWCLMLGCLYITAMCGASCAHLRCYHCFISGIYTQAACQKGRNSISILTARVCQTTRTPACLLCYLTHLSVMQLTPDVCCITHVTLSTVLLTSLFHHPQGRLLGIKDVFTPQVAQVAVSLSAACDPQVAKNASRIYEVRCCIICMLCVG
jgi:hypothetical protein